MFELLRSGREYSIQEGFTVLSMSKAQQLLYVSGGFGYTPRQTVCVILNSIAIQ